MKVKTIGSNQTQVTIGLVEVLVSYQTPVAVYDHSNHKAYRTEKKWSKTTTRHINAWFDNNKDVKELPQEYFDNLMENGRAL